MEIRVINDTQNQECDILVVNKFIDFTNSSVLARKNISVEQENKLVSKIQTDGIDFSLLEYF